MRCVRSLATAFAAAAISVASIPADAQEAPSGAAAPSQLETLGLSHIGFAVGDLKASVSFFVDTLGWKVAGGKPDYPSVFVTNGELFVTLWQTDPNPVPFDRRKNVGLHHMAITVRDLKSLYTLYERIKARPDVTIEFAPEFLDKGPTTQMMIRDPSGLRLEFIVPDDRMSAEEKARILAQGHPSPM